MAKKERPQNKKRTHELHEFVEGGVLPNVDGKKKSVTGKGKNKKSKDTTAKTEKKEVPQEATTEPITDKFEKIAQLREELKQEEEKLNLLGSEIRKLEDKLGISSKERYSLEFKVVTVEPVVVKEEELKADDEIVPVVESGDGNPEEKVEEVEEYIDHEAEKQEWKDKYDYTSGNKRGEINKLIEEARAKSSDYANFFDLNESEARSHYLEFLNNSIEKLKEDIENLKTDIKNEQDLLKTPFLKKSLEKLERELNYLIEFTSIVYGNEQLFAEFYNTNEIKYLSDNTNLETSGIDEVETVEDEPVAPSETPKPTEIENADAIKVEEKYPRSKGFKEELERLKKMTSERKYDLPGRNIVNPFIVTLTEEGNIIDCTRIINGNLEKKDIGEISEETKTKVKNTYLSDREKLEILESPLVEKIMELMYKVSELEKSTDLESSLADWLFGKKYIGKDNPLGSYFADLKYSGVEVWLSNSKDKLESIEKIIDEELKEVNEKLNSSTEVEKVNPVEKAENMLKEEKEKIETRIKSGEYIINKENKRVAKFDEEGNLTDYGRYEEGENLSTRKWLSSMEYEQTLPNGKKLRDEKEKEMKELLESDKKQLELIDSSLVKNILELGRRLGGMDKLIELLRRRIEGGVYQYEDLGVYYNLENNNDILRYVNYSIENLGVKREAMEAVFNKELALLENKEIENIRNKKVPEEEAAPDEEPTTPPDDGKVIEKPNLAGKEAETKQEFTEEELKFLKRVEGQEEINFNSLNEIIKKEIEEINSINKLMVELQKIKVYADEKGFLLGYDLKHEYEQKNPKEFKSLSLVITEAIEKNIYDSSLSPFQIGFEQEMLNCFSSRKETIEYSEKRLDILSRYLKRDKPEFYYEEIKSTQYNNYKEYVEQYENKMIEDSLQSEKEKIVVIKNYLENLGKFYYFWFKEIDEKRRSYYRNLYVKAESKQGGEKSQWENEEIENMLGEIDKNTPRYSLRSEIIRTFISQNKDSEYGNDEYMEKEIKYSLEKQKEMLEKLESQCDVYKTVLDEREKQSREPT